MTTAANCTLHANRIKYIAVLNALKAVHRAESPLLNLQCNRQIK